jgi:hypothetical protein
MTSLNFFFFFFLRILLDIQTSRKFSTSGGSFLVSAMFFFLTLRESSRQPGTIEPDVLPSSSSTVGLVPGKSSLGSTASSFRVWLTTWDFKDGPTITRKISCILALCFHIPLNIISIVSHGVHILMFVCK